MPTRRRLLLLRRRLLLLLATSALSVGGLAGCAEAPVPAGPVVSDPGPPATDPAPLATDPVTTQTSPASSASTTRVPIRATPTAPAVPVTAAPATTAPPEAPAVVVTVAYRVERRVADEATAGFEQLVEATLGDGRGWTRAGFDLVRSADAPHLIVLAEGDEVDRLCLPYDTYGEYSCQNGPVVALNAERWRRATPKWTGDLETYRAMLVNHEVGHLLGQRHPAVQCPAPGRPAPLMAQQSTELDGCLPNPWPLPSEVERAARHDLPIAPPFSRSKG